LGKWGVGEMGGWGRGEDRWGELESGVISHWSLVIGRV
jgi:hypothetical protein